MGNLFNDNWTFSKQALESTLEDVNTWEPVAIPHDWMIGQVKDLYENSTGWYRKEFVLDRFGKGCTYFSLRFEGVYMDCTVYINGAEAGQWKYGYSTFDIDFSQYAKAGRNEVIVKVAYQSPNSRWYTGAGIYRNVYLNQKQPSRIIEDGVYITPTLEGADHWSVELDTELHLMGTALLKHTVRDPQHQIAAQYERKISGNGPFKDSGAVLLHSPKKWDIGQGNVYRVETELWQDGQCVDSTVNRTGFRTVEMGPDSGFVINGRREKIFGVCEHHDLGCLGAAVNKTAIRKRLELLRSMGANAIRTAHNMPAPELMELADEMGFLICSESFDMWERTKTQYDYGRFFKEWAQRDVASWIRRDRNCPSLIMWCIGNEVYDTHADEYGLVITKRLADWVREHDPKQHAPITLGSNYMPWENTQKCADYLKLAGYNYAENYYHDHHEKFPDWIIYGSETASTVQSRGVYKFPYAQSVLADDDEQCSALGNSSTSWGARNTEAFLTLDRDAPFSLGQFIWTGFDYLGEPTPYHTKNSYLGQIDTAGFPKDSFYVVQSAWTDYRTAPMVHIFPYWDFSPGQVIDIRVASNAPKVELFFNKKSLGTFHIDHTSGKQLVGNWQLPYAEGVLEAFAYDESGQVIASDRRSSFGDSAQLTLAPDKYELTADGSDLIFIEIGTQDLNGIPVANANNRVEVFVTGAGRLAGLDNGDSTDYDEYKGTSRRLFSGKLLAVVQATDEVGAIQVQAESAGLPTATLELAAVPGVILDGASRVWTKNTPSPINKEVPVRKIELISEDIVFTESSPSRVVRAKIYPKDASYQELSWRLTDKAGIDSNLGSLEMINPGEVRITAIGDGELYLRCMSGNGSGKIRLISQLGMRASGLGTAYLDPYTFISGGKYTRSNIELTNGNERGVATSRETDSHVVFDEVDFGPVGADTLTLPLFLLASGDLPIEVWEGMPYEKGSEQICMLNYTQPAQWNTYREQTFTLPRRLKGITTVAFVFNRKVHLKGFSFERIEKAYDRLSAADYCNLSGDRFEITPDAIREIGNNVTLNFTNMDFTKGISKLRICGHTPHGKNSIRIQFNGHQGETQKLVEFDGSPDYQIQEFALEGVEGPQSVAFLFLPGSRFNFKWLEFVEEEAG